MEHLGSDPRPTGPIDLVADVTPELLICSAVVRAGLVSACGACLMQGPDERLPLAATDLAFAQFVTVQFSLWDGPEPEVVRTGAAVVVADHAADRQRWPMVAGQLAAEVTASAALPLVHQGEQFGVFSAYRISGPPFSDPDLADLDAVADSVAVIAAARLREPVLRLPESGIGQSVGRLMERFTLDASEAMAVLRAQAWKRDVTIPTLAAELAAGTTSIDPSWRPTA